jgi:hypothetical protein
MRIKPRPGESTTREPKSGLVWTDFSCTSMSLAMRIIIVLSSHVRVGSYSN